MSRLRGSRWFAVPRVRGFFSEGEASETMLPPMLRIRTTPVCGLVGLMVTQHYLPIKKKAVRSVWLHGVRRVAGISSIRRFFIVG